MRPYEIKLEPEKIYHIYNRANGNEKLYLNDYQYTEFLQKYKLYIAPIVDTYAYCLLPNHFHFLVKIKSVEELKSYFVEFVDFNEVSVSNILSRQFGKLFSSYSQWFNLKTERKGGLFMSGFKRKLVDDPFYYTNLVAYIHTNPIKHKLTTDLYEWTYSSFHAYASYNTSSKSRTSMKCDVILDFFGGKDALLDFHKNYNDSLIENLGLDLE